MANPATFQRIAALDAPAPVRSPNFAESAFSAMASGVQGWQQREQAEKAQFANAFPTLVASGMVSPAAPGTPGTTQFGGQSWAMKEAPPDWDNEFKKLQALGKVPLSDSDREKIAGELTKAYLAWNPNANPGEIFNSVLKQISPADSKANGGVAEAEELTQAKAAADARGLNVYLFEDAQGQGAFVGTEQEVKIKYPDAKLVYKGTKKEERKMIEDKSQKELLKISQVAYDASPTLGALGRRAGILLQSPEKDIPLMAQMNPMQQAAYAPWHGAKIAGRGALRAGSEWLQGLAGLPEDVTRYTKAFGAGFGQGEREF